MPRWRPGLGRGSRPGAPRWSSKPAASAPRRSTARRCRCTRCCWRSATARMGRKPHLACCTTAQLTREAPRPPRWWWSPTRASWLRSWACATRSPPRWWRRHAQVGPSRPSRRCTASVRAASASPSAPPRRLRWKATMAALRAWRICSSATQGTSRPPLQPSFASGTPSAALRWRCCSSAPLRRGFPLRKCAAAEAHALRCVRALPFCIQELV